MQPIYPLPGASSRTGPAILPLSPERVARAKFAYATRHLDRGLVAGLTGARPQAGDLILARVDRLGHHTRLELPSGRRAHLHPGDEIVVAMGNRYAPDQFEGLVPEDLDACHLVAAGGIAARVVHKHKRARQATRIQPLGLLTDGEGARLHLGRFALGTPAATPRPLTILVCGTSMNAGKTMTAAHLLRGLARAGLRVGAAKITGTGSGGDAWSMWDAGAERVLDFTDAGHATTYLLDLPELERVAEKLTGHLAAQGCEAVVLEVADGIYQRETSALLQSRRFRAAVDGLLFAGGDAMGAVAGACWLEQKGWPVLGLSGVLTTSPLGMREAGSASGLPVLDNEALADPAIHRRLADAIDVARRTRQVA